MQIKNLLLLVLIASAMIQVFVYLLGPSMSDGHCPSVRPSVRHLSFTNLFICVFVSLLILAMIQDQALVASKTKHLLIETETESRFEAVYLYFQYFFATLG